MLTSLEIPIGLFQLPGGTPWWPRRCPRETYINNNDNDNTATTTTTTTITTTTNNNKNTDNNTTTTTTTTTTTATTTTTTNNNKDNNNTWRSYSGESRRWLPEPKLEGRGAVSAAAFHDQGLHSCCSLRRPWRPRVVSNQGLHKGSVIVTVTHNGCLPLLVGAVLV